MAKKTPVKEEYSRIRGNLLRQYRGMVAEGLQFDKNPIPTIPKKVTAASIRKLEKVKADLLEKSWIIDPVTGEKLTGKQWRNVKRWRRKPKTLPPPPAPPEPEPEEQPAPPPFWDAVIDAYLDQLYEFEDDNNARVRKNAGRVERWIRDLLGSETEEEKQAVAEMLEAGAAAGHILTWEILYDDGLTDMYMTEMVRFFPGKTGEERDDIRKEIAEETNEDEAFDEYDLPFF